jgi:CYTH domain-containing protein
MIEIERKFLVTSEIFKKAATSEQLIKQGFLNTDKQRTVRVRLYGNKGFLTVKGKSNESGASRFEWEIEILSSEANALLNICEEGTIVKTRYVIPVGKHLFEVDEFHGDNQGLILAEVELNSEEEHFEKPDWLGKEVTGEINYYNSQLSKNPFKTWKK